jgi:hypothetical protein
MLTATRREHLVGLGALFGAFLAAPLARALAAMPQIEGGFTASHILFTPAQRLLAEAVSERIVPTTDTPGAIAAGVPSFMEMMLADSYLPAERDDFLAGLAGLEAQAQATAAKTFAQLAPEQQDVILNQAMQGNIPGLARRFFEHCRQLVILGYYSSEIGCKAERIYVPVPGRYDGAFPYAQIGRVFSA